MAEFDFTNFERKGNYENNIQLSSALAISEAVIKATENTLRTIKIFTPDLEAEIYNNDTFRKQLLSFTQGNRHAQIQILVDDISTALQSGHKLIGLAQQLSSIVTIKDTPADYQCVKISFILYDQSTFIFKPDNKSQKAILSNCKNRNNKLHDFFTLAWDQAEQNSHTRRLSI
ncbi:MAG: hypothetical protein DIZ80_01350 [endosymbiont of Galathealinum brachiosum]|uniref:DUF7931 domain-containing protein n=1 Tax=endosymbiont of Galathealinum brachiosum TaxID=2200906 RepID=A0A370DMT5_9GAMM|nr:MAG: hypothetical protein DIZ80_01350 [endosymbiont of Galathealinum brachiosum]